MIVIQYAPEQHIMKVFASFEINVLVTSKRYGTVLLTDLHLCQGIKWTCVFLAAFVGKHTIPFEEGLSLRSWRWGPVPRFHVNIMKFLLTVSMR